MYQLFAEATQPNSGIWCGNSVADPLAAILSFGAPLGVADTPPSAYELESRRNRRLHCGSLVSPLHCLFFKITA